MKLWIDGDSCPRQALDVALRARGRNGLELVVIADRILSGVEESGAELRLVDHGTGDVDDAIFDAAESGDWVLTRDFELGLRLLEKGVQVLNDRGKIWNIGDLKARVEESYLMQAMREGGMSTGGRKNYGPADLRAFAASLDRLVNAGGVLS